MAQLIPLLNLQPANPSSPNLPYFLSNLLGNPPHDSSSSLYCACLNQCHFCCRCCLHCSALCTALRIMLLRSPSWPWKSRKLCSALLRLCNNHRLCYRINILLFLTGFVYYFSFPCLLKVCLIYIYLLNIISFQLQGFPLNSNILSLDYLLFHLYFFIVLFSQFEFYRSNVAFLMFLPMS